MTDTWQLIKSVAEVVGMVFIPLMGWMLFTIMTHGKKIILLEERVNDSLNRRLTSLEDKVDSLEGKIETKIDNLESSVADCKLHLNDKLNEKFDIMINTLRNR